MKYLSSDKGQTLIEVIAAIAVGTIIITALLSLAARGNRNANFARTSAQATKIAQQGLEIIRNIDSVQATDAIINHTGCSPDCRWFDMYDEAFGAPAADYNFALVKFDTGLCTIIESWCLDFGSGTPNKEQISADLGNFTREVRIEDDSTLSGGGPNPCNGGTPPLSSTETKLVTVTVRWDDPSGAHQTEVSTCISNL